ncbi:MAG: diacylglycerol kinase [Sideroxyarcus sp.]|nr:diacylglycerol kinase [Sideroxyarcus sp.]
MNLQSSEQNSPHKGKTGLDRIIRAYGYSLCGLRAAFRHEAAFRQELLLALVLIPLTLFLHATPIEKALIIASIFGVLIVELKNSAIEAVVDLITLEHHELAKRAKDIGSAAVLLSLTNLAVVFES